jgi:hypothetical protein
VTRSAMEDRQAAARKAAVAGPAPPLQQDREEGRKGTLSQQC